MIPVWLALSIKFGFLTAVAGITVGGMPIVIALIVTLPGELCAVSSIFTSFSFKNI
jgi:hypothetical protein